MIELHQVVKTFETAAGPFTALKEINLQVEPGEFVAVIGKSGSGKSTLINMITGIDRPTSGEVFVGGTAVHTLKENDMAVWRGRNIGVVFQFFQLLPTLTVIENVMLPMDFCNLYSMRERHERAMRLLEDMEMADQADKLPNAISGGQQQRVAIARALANDPPIVVADEPTGNLDTKTAESVFRLFEELADEGKTILMVTHDADLAKRVTRTVIISDGEIIEEYLARTFPALTERQLIQATQKLERLKFNPGAIILRKGELPDKFYIVTKGEVEVLLHPSHGPDFVVSRLERGQYFGEIELLAGGENLATIRASAETGAEVVTLDQEAFQQLMTESEATRAEIGRVVQERIMENVTRSEENEHPSSAPA
ncbi:MAG: ATP-binding cassette domain-containing protein [Phycisphaerae bacterium]|nr:ATP-binding cassette domain-containing protein [Phycisphaerae bacterium]NIW93526.1 ATP-binding cassette domain-containing protein [Phycisphaerae bacterium]